MEDTFWDTVHKRRSIRKYTDEPLAREELVRILKAGMASPSAANAQTWDFVVVQDRQTLMALSELHPGANMLADAAAAIVVCGMPQREQIPGFWPQDCAAACQTMLLAVQASGLGGVWVGVHPLEEVEKKAGEILHTPEEARPFAILSIGHPAEELGIDDRYDEQKLHWDTW